MLLELQKSWLPTKKLVAVFDDHAPVHFGAAGYKDYHWYRAKQRALATAKRQAYIARHSVSEDWANPHRAGTLSRYFLWDTMTVKDYNNLFSR